MYRLYSEAQSRTPRRSLAEGGKERRQAVLERHVVLGREADGRAEDVHEGCALGRKGVHDGRARRHGRRLEHVREDGEDRVELLGRPPVEGEGDAREELCEQDEVEDERHGEERVLARVVQHEGVLAAHEDLGRVLVERALRVADVRDVLDDDCVVGALAVGVHLRVGGDCVVDDGALGDLLGAELRGRAEVLSVVVPEVVVGHDCGGSDPRADEKVDEHGLDLCLSALEVVAGDEDALSFGELDDARDERVLRRAVDVRCALEGGRDCEDCRRRDLGVVCVDGGEERVCAVVHAGRDVAVALRVCRPQHDDRVDLCSGLEVGNVLADCGKLLLARALDDVVCALLLVRGDEVAVVYRRERVHVAHGRRELALQVDVEDHGAAHGGREVRARDVPPAELNVLWADHREHGRKGDRDWAAPFVAPDVYCRGLREGAEPVGLPRALLGLPRGAELVCEQAGGERRAVVPAPADEHEPEPGDLGVRLDDERVLDWPRGDCVAVHGRDDARVPHGRGDLVAAVGHVRCVDSECAWRHGPAGVGAAFMSPRANHVRRAVFIGCRP